MRVSGGRKRSDRLLQRQVSLHNQGCRVFWSLTAGMTGRHGRLSAMPSPVMAALALRRSWGEARQQTRHRRCYRPQQDGAEHDGGSHAVHFHEPIPCPFPNNKQVTRLLERSAVTNVTGCYRPGHEKRSCPLGPRGYRLYGKRHLNAPSNMVSCHSAGPWMG